VSTRQSSGKFRVPKKGLKKPFFLLFFTFSLIYEDCELNIALEITNIGL
jgi:hypothetical protein